jgi:hypothetical protein
MAGDRAEELGVVLEVVGERASEGASQGGGLEGRQEGQSGRQSIQSAAVVFALWMVQQWGGACGTRGRLLSEVVVRPTEGKCFVGSGTAGHKDAFLLLRFFFFFLHVRQALLLVGVH